MIGIQRSVLVIILAAAAPGYAQETETEPKLEAEIEVDTPPLIETIKPPEIIRQIQSGLATFYHAAFHGRRTASGEKFNNNGFTAAHRTLPFGTRVRVVNPRNNRSVVVRVNDRGPRLRDRVIDLSQRAARELGLLSNGIGRVEFEVLPPEERFLSGSQ